MSARAELPLTGITVIDCGQQVAAPLIAAVLGDFGADVIKVEYPAVGDALRKSGGQRDGVPLHWKVLSRNKKSISLALNKPAGQDLFCRLLESTQADLVIEAFRPGTFERWNLSFERLKQFSPRVTLVRVSGFGQDGPYSGRPGFGTLAEAMSGFAHLTGQPDGPATLPPFPMADSVAGLYGAIGALLALFHRERTGGDGQVLDVSLLEPIISLFSAQLIEYDQLGINAQRMGSRVTANAPRNLYRTRDDRYVAIGASTQSIAERLFVQAMGMPEVLEDPRFSTNAARLGHVDEVDELVGGWVQQFTQEEALSRLIEAEVAAAPVNDMRDLMNDEHLRFRGTIASVMDSELGQIRMPAPLPRMSETPGRILAPGPTEIGGSNHEVYVGRLGLSESDLEDLRSGGVI